MIEPVSRTSPRSILVSMLLGAYAAAVALTPSLTLRLLLVAPVIAAVFGLWTIANPARWILVFLCSALVLPPLPFALGDSGPHLAILIAGFGLIAGLLRLSQWKIRLEFSYLVIAAYPLVLTASVALAAFYSGPAIAAASLARVLLFAISIYVFLYEAAGPGSLDTEHPGRRFRVVYWAAMLSALFACVDFYFQFPAPAGFGPQFVWLDTGVFRRAQGVFYEASTLGNLCAFFLTVLAVALSVQKKLRVFSIFEMIGGLTVFASALVLSFSRASLGNLFLAILTLLFLQRKRIGLRRLLWLPSIALGGGALASYFLFPTLTEFYWQRVTASVTYFFSATEGVLSGRLESWRTLYGFLLDRPWHAILGVGYKTLPYSDFIGRPVIADNAYLSSLVETGIVGLIAMLLFAAAILHLAFRAARHSNPRVAFLGACVFCFWIGEMGQMMSGDLLTYWRVLPVYLWTLGVAARGMVDEPPPA